MKMFLLFIFLCITTWENEPWGRLPFWNLTKWTFASYIILHYLRSNKKSSASLDKALLYSYFQRHRSLCMCLVSGSVFKYILNLIFSCWFYFSQMDGFWLNFPVEMHQISINSSAINESQWNIDMIDITLFSLMLVSHIFGNQSDTLQY